MTDKDANRGFVYAYLLSDANAWDDVEADKRKEIFKVAYDSDYYLQLEPTLIMQVMFYAMQRTAGFKLKLVKLNQVRRKTKTQKDELKEINEWMEAEYHEKLEYSFTSMNIDGRWNVPKAPRTIANGLHQW